LAMLKEAFGTADDQFANGLLGYLCMVLPINEDSAFEYPSEDMLNNAVSQIAAGKPVDEFHAYIFADLAVCRLTLERLLHNLSKPLRFHLSDELMRAVRYYKYDHKGDTDREIQVDNRLLLQFSVRSASKLMTTCVELIDAANRYRATFDRLSSMQQLSSTSTREASAGNIEYETASGSLMRSAMARTHNLEGNEIYKSSQAILRKRQNGNGHAPT
jgi:hypothetical protein